MVAALPPTWDSICILPMRLRDALLMPLLSVNVSEFNTFPFLSIKSLDQGLYSFAVHLLTLLGVSVYLFICSISKLKQ